MAWTDETITVNVTHIKKAHITELRAAIDAHRTAINSVGSNNNVHGLATSTQDGFMSHVDKAAFDNLIATAGIVLSVNAYLPITSTGGANPYISITPAASGSAGSMSAAHYAYLQGLIDKTKGIYSLAVTAPVKNTGSVHEPVLDIDIATQSTKGALSAEDKTKIDSMLSIPIGGIIMFNPPGGDIRTYFDLGTGMGKTGTGFDMSMFVICDGQNTSPDLTDRFVVAAGNKYASGVTGGEEEHTLTIEELAKHKHTKTITYTNEAHNTGNPWGSGGADDIEGTYSFTTDETGDDQPHNNMPPFYALYFIMRRN